MNEEAYEYGRQELISVLPGTIYMDPPDGGSTTILEQFQRMAKDAARYRLLRGYKLSGVWPTRSPQSPGLVAFGGTRVGRDGEQRPYSLDVLDQMLDEELGRHEPASLVPVDGV